MNGKVYLAEDEVLSPELLANDGNEESKEAVRLTVKKWESPEAIQSIRNLHFFSDKYPSRLLYMLCSVLESLGIYYTIGEPKMKVNFTREKPLNVWWEENLASFGGSASSNVASSSIASGSENPNSAASVSQVTYS